MKIKYSIIWLSIIFIGLNANAQNDNNTIIIQGVTYYFRPSTTPSSPQPERSGDFFKSGKWYGKDAAIAWTSLADWAIERCLDETPAIIGGRNEIVYISAVHIFTRGDSDYKTLGNRIFNLEDYNRQIRIDYWVVRNGDQISNGRRESRWFGFSGLEKNKEIRNDLRAVEENLDDLAALYDAPPAPAQLSVPSDFKFHWYLNNVRNKVESNWRPPNVDRGLEVAVKFIINSDGTASNVSVAKSSGNSTLDNLAVRAVTVASPFGKLPPGFSGDKLDVSCTLRPTRR